jgi:hypothetical protein
VTSTVSSGPSSHAVLTPIHPTRTLQSRTIYSSRKNEHGEEAFYSDKRMLDKSISNLSVSQINSARDSKKRDASNISPYKQPARIMTVEKEFPESGQVAV